VKQKIFLLIVAAFLGAGHSAAFAQDIRSEQVRFAAGTTGTTIPDRITGREYVVYRIGAEAGQRMEIRLTPDNGATYFNVYEPGRGPGDEALANAEQVGPMVPELNVFDGVLPASGVYSVSVYLYRSAARRGETSNYRLDISVTGATGAVVEGDFADGLQGGPDYWRVNAGGGLRLRDAPSMGARVLTTLRNGINLRNFGCRMAEGATWCRVAALADPGIEGWVAGGYLVEGSAEAAPQLPEATPVEGDALVPGTPYHATGEVSCWIGAGSSQQSCALGVIRQGDGAGIVELTLPDGRGRVIYYDGGAPVGFDQSAADAGVPFSAKRVDGTYVVTIGDSTFSIPDSVIFGG
jgi:hypothetical protein